MYVYFVRQMNSDFLKIGVADDVEKRLIHLQTGNPVQLTVEAVIECETLEAAFQLERNLHSLFRPMRVMGEWFNLSPIQLRHAMRSVTVVADHCADIVFREQQPSPLKMGRPAPAFDAATAWLLANPSRQGETHRSIAADTGMKESAVYAAQKALRAQQAASVQSVMP